MQAQSSIVGAKTPRRFTRENLLISAALVIIMLIGGYFRFVGLNWDDFTHLHPDERFLTDVAQGLGRQLNPSGNEEERVAQIALCRERYPETGGIGGYFDAYCSTLNPINANSAHGLYVYGTLPLFMARGTAEVVADASEFIASTFYGIPDYNGTFWTTYDGVHLVWRFLSALAEMSVIVLCFIIGARLHDKWIGLLAAFLYAATVFSIQMAHFGTVDAITNLFVALTLLAAVLVQREGKLINYAAFGFAFGCAVASRINLVPMAGLLVLASFIRALPALAPAAPPSERDRTLAYHAAGLVLAGALSLLFFRLFNPYAFDGPGFFGLSLHERWLDNMGTAQALVGGTIDSPPNYQWVNRAEYLYPLNNIITWGMGLPLGIAAWVSAIIALWRIVRGKPGALANVLLLAWIIVYFGWLGRSWVTTMRYFLPIYPPLIILAAWGLVTWARSIKRVPRYVGRAALIGVAAFALVWSGMFTNIYRNLLTRVQVSYWVWDEVPGDFAMRVDEHPDSPLMQIPLANNIFGGSEEDLASRVTRIDSLTPRHVVTFEATATGTISTIHAPHLGDPRDDADAEVLRFTISREDGGEPLATATLDQNLPRDQHVIGDTYDIPLDQPLEVIEGEQYVFTVELVEGDAVLSGGSIFTWEGAWDDPAPVKVCAFPEGVTLADNPPPGMVMDARDCQGLDPWWALINGYLQNIVWEDDAAKRDRLLQTLHNSDYIVITSNRFYDTLSRNPWRWPLTNEYYDLLFSGELGFDLAATFQETFELGPLRVSDQYLPTYDAPEWLNEFESEEAFSVYDHPVVFVFEQRDDYDRQAVTDALYSVPVARINDVPIRYNCPNVPTEYCDPTLASVAPVSSEEADKAPTQLQFTDAMREIQYEGGTWSERFYSDSTINTEPVITVAAWWGVTILFGLAAFPLIFVLTPKLATRGYGFTKFAGMFLAGWGVWVLASARIPVWNQAGIAGALIVLFVIGVALLWRVRGEFAAYLRDHWRRLLAIEFITLIAFLAFLAIRLTNPDLWHPSFGGEKPMDFAYFNGVLRSTIFPPIDPWQAGAYINYYYFGYVIVGAPTLLLGVVPSIAYNLIVPMLFAMTGVGAFAVAFDLVAAWRERRAKTAKPKRLANPYLAGIAALLLAVVMGNLDTPRQFLMGVARAGGYAQVQSYETYLLNQYQEQHGTPPDEMAMMELMHEAEDPSFMSRVRYEIDTALSAVSGVAAGFGRMLQGDEVYIGAERWFWGPSRVLAETPGVEGQAITEMPMFTFIYGDLHAHMISMPMQLLVIGLLLHELLAAGRDNRRLGVRALMIAVIGGTVGMLRATNTWDWITYLVLGIAALTVAWWLAQTVRRQASERSRFTRESALSFVGAVGGFFAASYVAVIPFTMWYASAYSSIRLWTDGKTPIWAYLILHGLFLFLVVSLLLWDTARWFRSVRVSALRGWFGILVGGVLITLALLAAGVLLALLDYQVTLIALPLLVWTAVLLLREGQSRAMQFVLLIVGLSLGLTLGVEFIVLEGDIGRQNTVFKFYLQAWLMFSIAGGAAFAWLMRGISRWTPPLRNTWAVVLVLLVGVASLFPVMAARGKAVFRFDTAQPFTLDGAAFMNYAEHFEGSSVVLTQNPQYGSFSLAEDYAMIRWLQENVEGSPVIIEGLHPEDTQYKWNGRISIFTGLPAVQGWNFHQRQQRTLEAQGRAVESRVANVISFYQIDNIGQAWDILDYYNVEYVIVGLAERAYYHPEGLAKIEQMADLGLLEVAFQEGDSTIYRVNQDAQFATVG